jgi:hypothetical protein
MDKWLKDILPDNDPYHNRGRDQMRKFGVPEFECLWSHFTFSAKDTKGRCSRYCYMQTSSCPEQTREPCYFMFFRINVAIVARTDFSSEFIIRQ